ncbi:MAG TPA: PGPGW domain-containing protein [Acidimicrobiia bacterium]|jgi:uncharacterized protein (TIGR02611 family)
MERSEAELRARRPLIVRIVLVLIGTILVLAGIIGALLPIVPGWVMLLPGLAILATEFVWARRLLDTAKDKAALVRAKVPIGRKKNSAA